MLIQFSVKNFKTFKEKATMSLVASNYDQDTREAENVTHDSKFDLRILKSVVVYGANASGKSKFVEALGFMRRFVQTSSKDGQAGDPIPVDPFRLNSETESASSEFEVIFISNNVLYRYGFEVDRKKVVSEWLYYKPKTTEVELFYRDGSKFDTHARNFPKGNAVIKEGLVRDNALLISVAAQFNDTTSIEVVDWFKKLKVISGLHEEGYRGFTMAQIKKPEMKAQILELLRSADLSVENIHLKSLDFDAMPDDVSKELFGKIRSEALKDGKDIYTDVLTYRKKFDARHQFAGMEEFSMKDDESSGTEKFFALTGPILDVLENGHTLIVDELDSKIHSNLVCKIVALFNSPNLNKKNAQLIFNTHDTNLLSSGLFRRDQIWFTEKNTFGEAKLYALSDFKASEVRRTDNFEEKYLKGKYGAVPYLGFWDNMIENLQLVENEG